MIVAVLALFGAVVGALAGAWLRRRRYLPLPKRPFGWWTVAATSVATAIVFGLLAWLTADTVQVLGVVFASGGVVAVWTELDGHRLPDWLTYPLATVLLLIVGIDAAATARWANLVSAGVSAVIVWAVFAVMSRFGSLGGGDVKLGLSLGLVLGFLGPIHVFAGVLAGFLIAAIWAVVLLARGRSKSSYLPLGPSLIFGAIACLMW